MRTALGHVALIVSMGLLGALLTFAPMPLYALHIVAAPIYGLTPLEDQQLAGPVMWVPAIVPNLLVALLSLHRAVHAADGARLISPA